MSPLAWLAAGVVAGVGLSAWALPLAPLWAAMALWTASLPAPRRRQFALVGVLLGLFAVAAQPPGPVLTGPLHLRGVVCGASRGAFAPVCVRGWSRAGGPLHPTAGRVEVRFRDRPPALGAEVLVWGRAEALPRRALPGAPDPLRDARRGRVHTLVKARRVAVLGRRTPATVQPTTSQHAGLLTALATGDRRGIDVRTRGLLRRTGTAHVLAISGFHVGLVGSLGGGLALTLLRLVAVWRPRGVPTTPAFAVAALCAGVYAVSAGAPVSAVRAAGLLLLLSLARMAGRSVSVLDLLAVVAAVQVCADPPCLGTPSFQLSYGAVLGLCLVTPRLAARVPERTPWLLRAPLLSLCATAGATVGTLGPAAWWLQSLPVASPLANLVALPVVACLLVPAALLWTWAPAPLDGWALWLGELGGDVLLAVLSPLDGPVLHPAVGPAGALALAALPVVWRYRGLTLALLVGVFLPRPLPSSRLTLLDIGQGDALVVDHPDGQTWLVDGGPRRREVLHYLRRTGRTHLDVVVATHNHPDHIEGLGPVLRELSVDELWIGDTAGIEPLLALATARGTRVRYRPGLAPRRSAEAEANDLSVVLPVLDAALLTGDAEWAAEEALLTQSAGSLRSEVLKLGHHGSRTSTSDALLDAVDPRLALVSCGRDNTYGHPHAVVTDRLAARDIPVFSTAEHGTLALDVLPDGLRLSAHHHGRWTPLWSGPRRDATAAPSPAPPR